MVAASTDPASRPSPRRTTPTSASTGGACSRSTPAAPRSSGAATSRSIDRSYQPPEPVVTTTFLDTPRVHPRRSSFRAATRRRAARPPTRSWCGCPRIARCSPGTSWVRSSVTSRTSTPFAATSIRSAIAYVHAARPRARPRSRGPRHRARRADPWRRRDPASACAQVRDATRVPPRPHHRGDERGRRPVHADGVRSRCRPSSTSRRGTARCRGSCARSGRSTPAGSATSRPPSSTTSRRRRSGPSSPSSPAAPAVLTERAHGASRRRSPARGAAPRRHGAGGRCPTTRPRCEVKLGALRHPPRPERA